MKNILKILEGACNSTCPTPTDTSHLRSFLGLVNYYGKFLPNLATTLAPLHLLLKKNHTWVWGQPQETAFRRVKQQLSSSGLLTHYDPGKPLLVTCDASPYGIGAVLSHKMENGAERPIAFASRTLTAAEKKYAQIEKEGLAVVFAVKRFHQYVYGRHFTIVTDHKPLLGLFREDKPIPPIASARIQRWALLLAAYEYSLEHKPGTQIANADALSRLPLSTGPMSTPTTGEVVATLNFMDTLPVTASQIREWTQTEPVLSKVKRAATMRMLFSTNRMLPSSQKDVPPITKMNNVVNEFQCQCDVGYVGHTSQRLADCIKQYVPSAVRNVQASDLNAASNARQIALHLILAGQQAIEIYNLLNFAATEDKSKFEQIGVKFDDHCNMQTNEILERFRLRKRIQNVGELVNNFITDLILLSNSYSFLMLCDSKIHDQIVFGIRDESLRL
ncbi:uncharacterized protein [Scyliorhinus torazame]|uniref:uncharacterized protein n=1 Tax=Scyliorhinus torazame TaxID=75743 RepID=UPI003B5CCBF4